MAFKWLARLARSQESPTRELATPTADPFRAMTEGTQAQWARIAAADAAFGDALPDRLLGLLRLLRDDCHAFAVDRLEHSLQTATRAHRDGRDEEYVTCALLHDIGALLAPFDHAELAACVLRPYVSEQNHWMVRHHDVFQGYYFHHFLGGDRRARDKFRGHPHYDYTVDFCRLYDQAAFDPDYASMSLDAFEPMLRRVMARPRA